MKKTVNTVGLLLLLIATIGCKKDLGNYAYTTLDSVMIDQIDKVYLLKVGTPLVIKPEISFKSKKIRDTGNFSYKWIAYKDGSNVNEPMILLHEEETLEKELSLPIGEYNVYYVVKDKSSHLEWTKKFVLKVRSGFNGGWMILSDKEGKANVDFFEYDHKSGTYPMVRRNFLATIKDPVTKAVINLPGKPKFITTWNNAPEVTGPAPKYYVYIGTDQAVEKINITDGFIWTDKYSFKYETANPPLFETIDKLYPVESSDGYVVKGNDVYSIVRVYKINVGTPINRLEDGTYFKVSPHIAPSLGFFVPSCLMYDITNKRFVMNVDFKITSSTPLLYDGNSAFNPNNVGMDLVWMNQTPAFGGRAYAVLTKEAKFFLARMDNNGFSFSAKYMDDISTAPEIAKAKLFEVHPLYGYLQYVVDGKIYQYDPDSKTTKLMRDYGNREITVFKYHRPTFVWYSRHVIFPANKETFGKRFLPLTTGLVVATYEPGAAGNTGKVDVLKVPQFNAPFEIFHSFDGFGKVVDATEAEVPYGW